MPETWRYRGQEIGNEQIVFLREFIAAHPDSSRWKLSRQLCEALGWKQANGALDRKSTRLNSSHLVISYAVFCLKKKKKTPQTVTITRLTHVSPYTLTVVSSP